METLRNIRIFRTTRAEYVRAENVLLWILQIMTAAVFLMAGSAKLSGNPTMIEAFADLGLGQWFRYLTGAIEIFAALLLLVPPIAPIGALLLVATMFGAIAAHLFVIGGSPLVPAILLGFSVLIFFGRSGRLARLAGARKTARRA